MEVKIKNLSGNSDVDSLIISANLICDGIEYDFNKESINISSELFDNGKALYFNPTEELRMGDIVKAGKKTATVLSSGDFAIDSIYHGVSDIICFDINKFQFFPAALKIKALQNMSYKDFYDFFTEKKFNSTFFDSSTYEKLKNDSENDIFLYAFFDTLLKRFNQEKELSIKKIKDDPFYYYLMAGKNKDNSIYHQIFQRDDVDFNKISFLFLDFIFSMFGTIYKPSNILKMFHGLNIIDSKNSYMENKDSFNYTKELICDSDIKYVNCDVSGLEEELIKLGNIDSSFRGFQSIYLSNIPEYMRGDYFINNVINKLMNILEDDGIIAYCCQGATIDDLNGGKNVVFDIINNKDNALADSNPFNRIRLVNNICGYELLKRKNYDVSLSEAKSLSIDNGYHDKDTFVYVKKK